MNLDLPPIVELPDESFEAIQDFFETQGWTDGLPFVPPTRARVDEMYRYVADRAPDEVIAVLGPRGGEATLERVATNAVMAGCRPEYFPVVVAAVQAVGEESFNLTGVQATTHPSGVLVLVNGPIAAELGINSGPNCFGQGVRANVTIGRALRLALLNIGGGTPGEGDRATHGTPAKIAYCAAENEAENPWQPLHVEHGFEADDSVVSVVGGEAPHNLNDHDSISGLGLLTTFATAMRQPGSNNLGGRGQPMLVLGPEHASAIARDGYSKDDVKRFVFEHAVLPADEWSPDWRGTERLTRVEEGTPIPDRFTIAERWQDVDVVVAGGPGKHSCWVPTFGGTATVRRRIERADGSALRSVFGQ